ncbi:MAG TPA: IclR family transcriptional regulator, partial [Planctomycetota bacterium]|nr:IclR family transcriptional regulator [Planctomycetota bacterium]
EKTLRFRLTEKLLRVSQPRVERKGLIEVSMDALRALRDECRETVQIGRRFGDEGVILEQVEGLHPLRISVDPGLRFPLHNNAPGKLLLAFMPEAARVAALRRIPMTASTPRTLIDRHELARECARIREQGYSVDFAEADEGIHCVAGPILDARGEAIAALWISAPSRRLPRASFAEAGVQVRRACSVITDRLRTP